MPTTPDAGVPEANRLAVYESAPDPVLVFDARGEIVAANLAARRQGMMPATGGPSNLAHLLAQGNPPEIIDDLLATLTAGVSWHGELSFRGGPRVGARLHATAWQVDGSEHELFAMICSDLSAFGLEAAATRRHLANLEALMEAMPIALAVERDGLIVFANTALLTMLGWDESGLVGAPWSVLFHPEDRWIAPGDGVAGAHEVRAVRKDGSPFSVECHLVPVHYDEHPSLAFTLADLEEKRHIELRAREIDRMAAIGTLAAGIAHEINTPAQFIGDNCHFIGAGLVGLAALRERERALITAAAAHPELAGLVDVVLEKEREIDLPYLEERLPVAVARTLEGVGRVATIVKAMKEFGLPVTEDRGPVDLEVTLQNIVIVARNEVKYDADVVWDLGGIPPVVCNAGEMNQVFLNLLVNAAHAIRSVRQGTETRGSITLRTRQEGDTAIVSIRDDGSGIPASVRSRIFDPFFTTKPVGMGTGQGLAIARSVIVERHGGRIWFETEEGVGTVFYVELSVDGAAHGRG